MSRSSENVKTIENSFMSDYDKYLFGRGIHYEIYDKMGAHIAFMDGQEGVRFALWAPNAKEVFVAGDFNGWDYGRSPMAKTSDSGIFECFVPGAKAGQSYKYVIKTPFDTFIYKADPYGSWSQMRPENASRIYADREYPWEDGEWMENRKNAGPYTQAMSIYECHIGSWRKDYSNENQTGFYSYIRFASEITEYVLEMGYTHVELMGIAEHPLDASWGYQVTGYYAPTSRYGSPDEFKYLVNYLHRHGIGVILDWVPAHFPKDAHGLACFDGFPEYEHADPRQGEHPDWGTKVFNYGRAEVSNFLIANALYWVEKYHVDGLRVDAVASMLYLDYGRGSNWVANKYGGRENLEAIEFLKHLNSILRQRDPGVVTIAEDSTAWPKVTAAPEDGGLGFTYKWNMGWMHDFLDYIGEDAVYRKYDHNKMTFSLMYAFSENYILVLSHDEVVHLKKSMFEKYPGSDGARYEDLKSAYAFMVGHPGKKLLFMGNEFGQRREWSEERQLDWEIMADGRNYDLKEYVKALLHVYRNYPAVCTRDSDPQTFEWINADDKDRSIFSFVRWSPDGMRNLLFVCNFTPVDRMDYKVGVPRPGKYKLVLDSESARFGGSDITCAEMEAARDYCDGREYSISFALRGFEAVIWEF